MAAVDVLAHTTLTSNTAGIEHTSLSGAYQHLYCVWSVRDDTNNYYGDCGMYFNSATGSSTHPLSYTRCHQSGSLTGTSTRGTSSAGGGALFGFQNNGNNNVLADTYSCGTAWILNYAQTGYGRPIILETVVSTLASSDTQSCMLAGFYGNTANAITAVKIFKQSGGNFLTGSTFTIYGVNSA